MKRKTIGAGTHRRSKCLFVDDYTAQYFLSILSTACFLHCSLGDFPPNLRLGIIVQLRCFSSSLETMGGFGFGRIKLCETGYNVDADMVCFGDRFWHSERVLENEEFSFVGIFGSVLKFLILLGMG